MQEAIMSISFEESPDIDDTRSAFSCSGLADSDSYNIKEFIDRAFAILKKRLYDLPVLDEGDLFATCLLALYEPVGKKSFRNASEGFISIIRFLFEKCRGDLSFYTFSAFWDIAGDELIYYVWQSSIASHRKVRFILWVNEVRHKLFRKSAFPKDLPRNRDKPYFCSASFLVTSWQQFLVLRGRLQQQIG